MATRREELHGKEVNLKTRRHDRKTKYDYEKWQLNVEG